MSKRYREPRHGDPEILAEKERRLDTIYRFLNERDEAGYKTFILAGVPETTAVQLDALVRNFREQLRERDKKRLVRVEAISEHQPLDSLLPERWRSKENPPGSQE